MSILLSDDYKKLLPFRYPDIPDSVESVQTIDFFGTKMRVVVDRRLPKNEIHLVDNGQCVGKIIL